MWGPAHSRGRERTPPGSRAAPPRCPASAGRPSGALGPLTRRGLRARRGLPRGPPSPPRPPPRCPRAPLLGRGQRGGREAKAEGEGEPLQVSREYGRGAAAPVVVGVERPFSRRRFPSRRGGGRGEGGRDSSSPTRTPHDCFLYRARARSLSLSLSPFLALSQRRRARALPAPSSTSYSSKYRESTHVRVRSPPPPLARRRVPTREALAGFGKRRGAGGEVVLAVPPPPALGREFGLTFRARRL